MQFHKGFLSSPFARCYRRFALPISKIHYRKELSRIISEADQVFGPSHPCSRENVSFRNRRPD